MFVHIKSEPGLWTVGHYDPKGKWHPDSDHDDEDKARAQVATLNGGGPAPAPQRTELLAPTIIIEQTRLPDGTDRVSLRGVFVGTLPDELQDVPEGTQRQCFTCPIGHVVDVPCFRFVTVHRGEGTRGG